MRLSVSPKIETIANLSVIVAALMFSSTIVKERWLSRPGNNPGPSAATESFLKGNRLQLRGVEWSHADKTLVMALSTQCHFCRESAPFYKELTTNQAIRANRVAIVTVFPQEQGEAESFVKGSLMRVDDVISMSLQALGISTTPTLLLVDRTGKIQRLWMGVLSLSQRKDLIDQLTKAS